MRASKEWGGVVMIIIVYVLILIFNYSYYIDIIYTVYTETIIVINAKKINSCYHDFLIDDTC